MPDCWWGGLLVASSFTLTADQPKTPSAWDMVSKDFTAGMAGDAAALDRVVATCGKLLAKNPKHASAMAIQGSCWFYQGGAAYQQGNWQRGQDLYGRGLARMDQAVALAPKDQEALMTRGMTLVYAGMYDPRPETAKAMLTKAVGDLSEALRLAGKDFATWPAQERDRLHLVPGDGCQRLGEAQQRRQQVIKKRPGNTSPRGRSQAGTIADSLVGHLPGAAPLAPDLCFGRTPRLCATIFAAHGQSEGICTTAPLTPVSLATSSRPGGAGSALSRTSMRSMR